MSGIRPTSRVLSRQLDPTRKRVFLIGATGRVGQAAAKALITAGHDVVALVQPGANIDELPSILRIRFGNVMDPFALERDGFQGDTFDVLVSCLESGPGDAIAAWDVNFKANKTALETAIQSGVTHVVYLSTLHVQQPDLEYQKAKLAFEDSVRSAGPTWSIVRPSALFNTVTGQLPNVVEGDPFLLIDGGRRAASKPISANDLGQFVAECASDHKRRNAVLPVGGPGLAVTQRDIGELIFRVLQKPPNFRDLPLKTLDRLSSAYSFGGRISSKLTEKAEQAATQRYFATESCLQRDPNTGAYEADATPSYGVDELEDFIAQAVRGEVSVDPEPDFLI